MIVAVCYIKDGFLSEVVCCEQIRYRSIDARLIYFVADFDKARILLTDFEIYSIFSSGHTLVVCLFLFFN